MGKKCGTCGKALAWPSNVRESMRSLVAVVMLAGLMILPIRTEAQDPADRICRSFCTHECSKTCSDLCEGEFANIPPKKCIKTCWRGCWGECMEVCAGQ